MAHPPCPHCHRADGSRVHAHGTFRRADDSRTIQRYRCASCRRTFYNATFSPCYRQKKRRINRRIFRDLSSNKALRRIAMHHNISKITLYRSRQFLGQQSQQSLQAWLKEQPLAEHVQMDDAENAEHTRSACSSGSGELQRALKETALKSCRLKGKT